MNTLAAIVAAFTLIGNVHHRHTAWAQQAAQHVQLPRGTFVLQNGSPEYVVAWRTLYIPFAGTSGWTYHAEHGEFVHELGHAYFFTTMPQARKTRFRVIIGTRCAWFNASCVNGGVRLAPGEALAEMYASCALGLTQAEYQAQGYMTYGWRPPAGTDSLICALFR